MSAVTREPGNNIAENTDTNEVPAAAQRVSCKSARSVYEICEVVCRQVDSVISKQSRLTKEEKQRYRQRFTELYKDVFRANILVDGEPCLPIFEDAEATSEFEPVNLAKSSLISEVLIPQLDDSILKTVKKRRTIPKTCRKNLKAYSALELKYLTCVQIQNVPKSAEIMSTETVTTMGEAESLSSTLNAIAAMSKAVVEDYGKLQNLEKAKEMAEKVKQSQTHQMIFKCNGKENPPGDSCPTPKKKTKLTDQILYIDQCLQRCQSPRFSVSDS